MRRHAAWRAALSGLAMIGAQTPPEIGRMADDRPVATRPTARPLDGN